MAFNQSHPRISILSTFSPSSVDQYSPSVTSNRFSLSTSSPVHSQPYPVKSVSKPSLYDRNLNKTRTADVSLAAYAFLFSEIIQYTQKRVSGINDLEKRLNTLGYRIGSRAFELMSWRTESGLKAPKREIRFLPALMIIHTQVWRAIFAKPADALEKSVEHEDEYMIIDNDPSITRYISVPREMSQLSCSSLTAGVVEAVMDCLGFPARVTAHSTPTDTFPSRITILLKLEKSVLEREELFK